MPKTEPFDVHSDRYDAWFERNHEAYVAELEAVRRLIPPPPARGMEVGVGSGKFAGPLGIRIGVEPSEEMAAKAERLGIEVFRNAAEALPFGDAAFDFVLMVTTICFVDDIPKSFEEAYRVLKPGGCLIVGFVDRESDLGKRYEKNRAQSVFYQDAVFVSAQEVRDYFADAGFGDLAFTQTLIPGDAQGVVRSGYGKGAFVAARGVKTD